MPFRCHLKLRESKFWFYVTRVYLTHLNADGNESLYVHSLVLLTLVILWDIIEKLFKKKIFVIIFIESYSAQIYNFVSIL